MMIDVTKPKNVIAKTTNYVDSIVSGCAKCLAEVTFIIDYGLMTNLLGKAFYGQIQCERLSFQVKWVVYAVKACYYTGGGHIKDVYIPNDLRKVLNEGKLSRLVKGCLIYLDHLESGPKTYLKADINTLEYNVKNLTRAMYFKETAYVSTKHELEPAYNMILYAMCQECPSPLFGGVDHVKIPDDGKVIYLVGYSPIKHYRNVVVTPELVMHALVEYSNQFWLAEELESAMIIACSLRQNRYLEVVRLPDVHSCCDLINPALCGSEAGGGRVTENIKLSKEAGVMLDGMITCLKKGVKNQIRFRYLDSFDVFKQEVILGGCIGDSELGLISEGDYNVSA
ncbi:unnamed protein product [Cochlearia groenlandica]